MNRTNSQPAAAMEYKDVINFWFNEIDPSYWFRKSVDFDQLLQQRFGRTLESASRCELAHWREAPDGRLAEIIVLDQFSRNIHRDTPGAFAQDALALALAQEAVHCGADQQLETRRRVFFYMPYMHSESPVIHAQAVRLYDQPGMADSLTYEKMHKDIIDRFGRYPHRNAILGRASTAEEIEFLKQPGSGF
ncbi:DUF924 family protein [Biformimicrobium ophioploci]